MILICNIGNRDVNCDGCIIDSKSTREKGEELLNKYEQVKHTLSYPLIEPFFNEIKGQFKKVYLFVTNQEDEKQRNSDTLFFGQLIQKWIQDTYNVETNIISYCDNPTDYEHIFSFYTTYFTQQGNIFDQAEKKIIALSGGTPQMNGALYIILSSLYTEHNEFYNVYYGKLVPINHERTINKIFIKKSCKELVRIHEYQSIITLLEQYNVQGREQLILFLNYAKLRKNFDFKEARNYFEKFLNSLPSSEHKNYDKFQLKEVLVSLDLIKELYWNIELCYENQNYLLLVALLFRLEEALLFEVVNYLFKNYFSRKEIKGDLNDKETHKDFIEYLEKEEYSLFKSLEKVSFKGRVLKIKNETIDRPVLFYIAKIKINQLKSQGQRVFQIDNMLEVLDKVNKYCYDALRKDKEKLKQKYGTTDVKCLGDLRNSSIIAHGFEPVSEEKIKSLYGNEVERIISDLKKYISDILKLFLKSQDLNLENIFAEISNLLLYYINKL